MKKKYLCLINVMHDGKFHEEGSVIELSDEHAKDLLELELIQPVEEKEKPKK